MAAIVSTTVMITRLEGCLGTGDLSNWEESFVRSVADRMHAGDVTKLSDKQIETLDSLHAKHFAG